MTAMHRLTNLLQDVDYRRIWLVGLCSGTSRWLELLVLGVYAFETTGSPLLVSLLVTLRLVPLMLLGSVIGTFADRASPRLLLIVALSAATAVSATVCGLFIVGRAEYWVIAVATVVSGMVWATDMPLRRRMLGDIAGKDRLAAALSLDSAANNATRMLGPLLGGVIFQLVGAAGAFGLMVALYSLAVMLTTRIAADRAADMRSGPVSRIVTEIREAFSFAIQDRDILRILLVTVVFNIWGFPFLSMIPVIGSEQLNLGAGWIGGLAALEGAGAFLGALVIAMTAQPAFFRRLYFFGTITYVLFEFLAGWMLDVLPMGLTMFCVGLGAAGFSAMQSTLIYSTAPPHMRGRLLGLLVICIGTGVVGMFNIGLTAEWFGAATAIKIVAAEGLFALVLIGLNWPELWGRLQTAK